MEHKSAHTHVHVIHVVGSVRTQRALEWNTSLRIYMCMLFCSNAASSGTEHKS
eukprot:gene6982-9582_t